MSGGKRVENTPAGQRAARGGVKPGAVIAVVVGVLLAAYVGLCVWVNGQQAIFPNVSVRGVDVSGMSETDAMLTVRNAMESCDDLAVVTVSHGDWKQTVCAADLVPFEAYDNSAALNAMWVPEGDHLLLKGFHFLRHLMGGSMDIPLELNYWGQEQATMDALLKQAQDELGSDSIHATYAIDGEKLVMTKGRTDISVDEGETAMMVYKALEQEVFPALFRGETPDVTVDLVVGEVPAQAPDFNAIYTELYSEVVEPAYDKETGTVSEHVVGVDFNVDALKAAYEQAAEGETFSIPITVTQPKDTKEAYEKKLFVDVLGSATSKVGGTANRKTNVKLSAAACDGVILLPGEIFAYNETTGSRSADKGYLPAPTYNAGASVDDVGGGICQTSSTIYYALLHTTLEVVERQNHSYATGYVPDGMDATVFYGVLDFRFKNNTNYPVKVVTESYDKGGNRYLKVSLMGTNEDGRYAKPTNTVFEVVEPTTSYLADSTVPQGTLVLDKQQNAYRGRKAQVTRTIYEADGTVVEQQDMGVSRYKMRPHLYHYNPLDGDPATWPNGMPPQPVPVAPVEPAVPEVPVTPVVPETPVEPVTPVEPQPDPAVAPAQ